MTNLQTKEKIRKQAFLDAARYFEKRMFFFPLTSENVAERLKQMAGYL